MVKLLAKDLIYYSRQSFWSAIFFTFMTFLTAVKRWEILTQRSLSHFVHNQNPDNLYYNILHSSCSWVCAFCTLSQTRWRISVPYLSWRTFRRYILSLSSLCAWGWCSWWRLKNSPPLYRAEMKRRSVPALKTAAKKSANKVLLTDN